MSKPILSVEHLSMKFGGLVAIGDLSFEAKRGEITALIGPNGAGKTTVFNCITGFYKPSEGMIRLSGHDGKEFLLERMPDFRITAQAKVARTFQNIRLFSGMTLLENLLVAQHNKLMKASGYTVLGLLGIGGYRKASAESVDLAKFWLEKAELIDRADDPAGDLPYGAQRRLEIARAMCTGPELLCLDEPAAGLNPKESLALNTLLIDIKDNTGTSILLIEHDMSVVMQISDHVVVLEYGRKISDGNPESVRNDPRVIAAYLGVDDEEVEDVLIAVGDDHVIEQLDVGPDSAHGPGSSSSMLAGPVSDTIGHSEGERITVADGASKASQVDARAARAASASAALAAVPAAAPKAAPAKPVARKPAAKPVEAKPASTAAKAKPEAKAAKPKAAVVSGAAVKPAASTKPVATAKPAATTAKAPTKPTAASAGKASAKSTAPAKASAKPVAKAVAPAKAATSKPVKAAPKPASAKPAAKAAPAPKAAGVSNRLAAPRGNRPDNLTRIKGIGLVNEKKLNEHGIFHFDQIAAWKKADVVAAEAYLAFDGRIAREEWVKQAALLDKGKETEFSKRVDAGKVATSHPSQKPKSAAPKAAKSGERK
ncbi:ATP-binding cassette domain-containing protein [Mesorhizobium sp. CGMCC 1.15528]|uniref:ATP-binding cassette domain-containing protein n=1 Tax=Mesorhizobium zhangyense TaxID=1776730 RepID=A0A7C9VA02_9HYPH|nr:ABC transporter ATP-binding protein [Mesorhizobium zhangyense]NGN42146.1 ATP-binding cassette domain-containing protein [Mesorhizobium zhangyense]